MALPNFNSFIYLAVCLLSLSSVLPTLAATQYYNWNVELTSVTRNCVTKNLVAVNGQFPGPTVYITEGDRVVIKVTNNANTNLTIHWHGVRQFRTCWQDGVGQITQCSIQPGDYFIYDFYVSQQRGTTFWHAHVNWVRATVHGAFVTRPLLVYPFKAPGSEFSVILGEWWNGDVEQIEADTLAGGGAFPLADALTLNGYPGSFYNCSATEGVTTYYVKPGQTYLVRIINAALNTPMFFGIANHLLTVVEIDSSYVKPYTVQKGIMIHPGQTMNVLVTANQPPGTYYIEGRSYETLLVTDLAGIPAVALPFVLANVPPISTSALFQYSNCAKLVNKTTYFPVLPVTNDTQYAFNFENSLKTLYPSQVPPSTPNARQLLFSAGTGTELCTAAKPCAPAQGLYRVVGALNNISFQLPTIAILQAYAFNISGVYSPTFPDTPPIPYDYTNADSPPDPQQIANLGTRVVVVEYGATVELVLQDNNNFAFESHPFHLHGFFFHVLGQGFGDYNAAVDRPLFNNYDPPARFTISVPTRGWVAIRFVADNPGAWLFHCHLDKHTVWGMETVFIVKNGVGPLQTLSPPPARLTKC